MLLSFAKWDRWVSSTEKPLTSLPVFLDIRSVESQHAALHAVVIWFFILVAASKYLRRPKSASTLITTRMKMTSCATSIFLLFDYNQCPMRRPVLWKLMSLISIDYLGSHIFDISESPPRCYSTCLADLDQWSKHRSKRTTRTCSERNWNEAPSENTHWPQTTETENKLLVDILTIMRELKGMSIETVVVSMLAPE